VPIQPDSTKEFFAFKILVDETDRENASVYSFQSVGDKYVFFITRPELEIIAREALRALGGEVTHEKPVFEIREDSWGDNSPPKGDRIPVPPGVERPEIDADALKAFRENELLTERKTDETP